MKTSNLWSALVLCCIACGSSFHSGDAATGGDGSGGSLGSAGSDVGSGGTHSSAGTSSGAGTHSGGGTSSGGVIGVGGDLSIAGTLSTGGIIGVAGDIGIAGAPMGGNVGSSGGPSGGASGSAGSAGMAGSGGTSGADCTKLWTTYWNLVLKAQACDAGSTSCVANSNIINECSCAVPVNSSGSTYSEAKKALQTYKAASCPLKQCPCAVPGPVSCLPSSGTATYSCQPSVVTTQ